MASSAIVGALKAVLSADTAAFSRAMADASADVKLLGDRLQKDLEPRQRAVNAAVRDFLGGNEIRRAQEYALAVEKIGGASVLTANDQLKVNKAVTDALGHYQKLGTQAPANLIALADATKQPITQLSALEKVQAHVRDQTSSMTSRVKEMALGYVTGQAALNAFAFAGRKVLDFLTDSIKAALDADQTQRKLTAALVAQGTATPAVLQFYDDLAKKYQQTTVFSTGLIKEQATLLTQMGSVLPREMDAALNAVTNLASGMGVDLESATRMVAKAFEDNFTALKKAGVQVDETRAKTEGMSYVLAQINARFGGQAQADVESYAGQIKQLENNYADLKEELGKAVIDTGLLDTAMVALGLQVALIQGQLSGTVNWLKTLATITSGGFSLTAIAKGFAEFQARTEGAGKAIVDFERDIKNVNPTLDRFNAAEQKRLDDIKKKADAAAKALREAMAAYRDEMATRYNQIRLAEDVERVNRQIYDSQDKLRAATFNLKVSTTQLTEAEQKRMTGFVQQMNLNVAQIKGAEEYNAFLVHQAYLLSVRTAETENATDETVSLTDALSSAAAGFQQLAQISGDEMGAVFRVMGAGVSAAGQLAQAVETIGKSAANSFAGTAAGLSSIVGILSVAADIIESTITPTQTLIMREVGKKWGVAITDGLAQQITDARVVVSRQAIQSGGMLGETELRRQAELLNIADIIEAGGGLNTANLDEWATRVRDLFALVAVGGETGAAATLELNDAVSLFAAQADETGGLWSAAFQSIIADARSAGVELDGLADAISGQLDAAASATSKIVGGFIGTLPTMGDGDMDAEGAKEKAADIVAHTQAQFDRVSRIALASFNAMVASGRSAADAIAMIGPSIDELAKTAESFGFAGSEAFNQLSRWRDLTAGNQGLLDQIAGLNELMVALGNVGALDVATFQDLQDEGVEAFKQLSAAGFTQNEALTQMAPFLENIIRLHDERGLMIDEETQALIDQAREQGVLQGEQISTNDILIEGIGALITLLGGELPQAWRDMATDAEEAAVDVQESLGRIRPPSLTIPIRYSQEGLDMPEPPHLGRGGIVTRPTLALIGESGPEAVIPLNGSSMGSPMTIIFEEDGRRKSIYQAEMVAGALKRLKLVN